MAEDEISVGDNDLKNFKNFWKTLKTKWETRPLNLRPKMVFSVIGDSDSFVPKPWPKSKFQSALITAAKNAGESLILYRGRKTGISRVVYEAFKKRYRLDFYNDEGKSNVEASQKKRVAKCSCLQKKEQPNDEEMSNAKGKKTSTPLIQLIGIQEEKDKQKEKNKEKKKKEKEHESGYDFEDTVYEMIYKGSGYTNFLVTLEEKISKIDTTFSEVNLDFSKTPLIIVLLEGDDVSIQHMRVAIKNNLPVVIVQGTGKAADLIVDCIECNGRDDIKKKLQRRAPLLFGTSFEGEKLTELTDIIEEIQERQWLINVFNLNTDDPELLSQITGEAVICGWSMENIKEYPNDLSDKVLYKETNESDPPAISKPEENRQKTTQMSNKVDPLPENEQKNVSHTVTKSISIKLKSQISADKEEEENVEDSQSVSTKTSMDQKKRRYVLDSNLMSPASLPLHFYFQYQTLQEEAKTMKK